MKRDDEQDERILAVLLGMVLLCILLGALAGEFGFFQCTPVPEEPGVCQEDGR